MTDRFDKEKLLSDVLSEGNGVADDSSRWDAVKIELRKAHLLSETLGDAGETSVDAKLRADCLDRIRRARRLRWAFRIGAVAAGVLMALGVVWFAYLRKGPDLSGSPKDRIARSGSK